VPRVQVNGVELQYETEGSGPEAVAFLNGIAMSIAHWKPLAGPLSAGRLCLSHDFRGQLLSGQAPGGSPLRLEDHVEDLRQLLRSLGIARVHLVGTSYGAEVAMMFAYTHPDQAESLVVIDGASELDPLLRAAAEAWKAAALADPIVFYRGIIPWNYSAGYIGANREALARREAGIAGLPRGYFLDFAALCDAFLALDITPHLSRISCPTLVIVGERDILKHVGFARIIADGIPGARLRVLAGAGHAVVIEQPEAVLAEVREFLQGLEKA
jgi:3-oxoadipate enol-lactonase